MSYSTVDQCTKQKPCDKYTLGGFGNYAEMRAEYLPEKKIQYIYGPTCCKIDRYHHRRHRRHRRHNHRGEQCDNHASGMAGQMSLEQYKSREKNSCK
jgi:hypothetical protein